MEAEDSQTSQKRRVLLVYTRDPRGRVSGRKLVLRTILESMISLGHDVTVAYFGKDVPSEEFPGARFLRLQGPNVLEQMRGCLAWVTPWAKPLNEVLYRSSRARRQLDDLLEESHHDLIVTDMIRTASYGERSGLPWIADLDDLLSDRYRRMSENDGMSGDLLGYHRSAVLRMAVGLLKPLGGALLRREARLIANREDDIARSAKVATLVGSAEAAKLSERTRQDIASTPMSVRGPSVPPDPVEHPEPGLVFLGGLDYRPNLRAVESYDTTVNGGLRLAGIKDATLHVVGFSDENHRAQFSKAISLHGYSDNLTADLRRWEAMLVPEVDPGGIKTKIVEAAFAGVVVLAHSSAVQGLGVTSRKELIVWTSTEELATAIHGLRSKEIDRAEMVQNAFAWADENFGFQHVRSLWGNHVDKVLAGSGNEPTGKRSLS